MRNQEKLFWQVSMDCQQKLRAASDLHTWKILQNSQHDGEYNPPHMLLLNPANYVAIETGLIFAGLAGLRDHPREEVFDAVEDCLAAGIRVMVITGDNKETTEAICHEIGVFSPDEDISLKSFTGREFMALEDKKTLLQKKCRLLLSRADPRHKQEIMRLLKEDGEVISMTGDEVAKEDSDMLLADNNFSTIVVAVGEDLFTTT